MTTPHRWYRWTKFTPIHSKQWVSTYLPTYCSIFFYHKLATVSLHRSTSFPMFFYLRNPLLQMGMSFVLLKMKRLCFMARLLFKHFSGFLAMIVLRISHTCAFYHILKPLPPKKFFFSFIYCSYTNNFLLFLLVIGTYSCFISWLLMF